MPIGFVREAFTWTFTDGTQNDVVSVTGSADIAASRMLVIPWQNGSNNTNVLVSVSDSKSNAYALTATNTNDSHGSCGIAYGNIQSALVRGTDTITFNWTNTSSDFKMGSVILFSGAAMNPITGALETSAITAATSGTAVSDPITAVGQKDLYFYVLGQEQTNVYTPSVPGGFTAINHVTNNSRLDYGYRLPGAAGSYDPAGSYGATTNWFGSIAAFNAFSLAEDYWQNSVAVERIIQGEAIITVF